MLVELGLVEQRLSAVLEVVNDGVSVTEVAERFGVTRQSVHRWLRRYATHGLAGLVDQSTVPGSCPHQMTPEVEARVVEMRVEHPGWGPRTIGHWLGREFEDDDRTTRVMERLLAEGVIHPSPSHWRGRAIVPDLGEQLADPRGRGRRDHRRVRARARLTVHWFHISFRAVPTVGTLTPPRKMSPDASP